MREKEQAFLNACSEFLEERVWRGSGGALWSLDHLTGVVNRVAGMAAGAQSAAGEHGTADWWTVTTARCVRIWRGEVAKARRIDDWNRERERKAPGR